jgi:hypothetical protein
MVFALAAALAFLRWPRALPALLVAYLALAYQPIDARIHQTAAGTLFAGIARERDWIDRRVPAGQEVVALHSGAEGSFAIWENEFFNRRVGRVLYLGAPTGGNLPEAKVAIDQRTGVLHDGRGRELRARWVLTDSSVAPAGKVVARDERRGMLLLRTSGPLRSTTRITGLWPDTWSGPRATYTRHECRGGAVAVSLQSDPSLFRVPQVVTARVAGRPAGRVRIPAGGTGSLRVPLRGSCTVVFSVAPTAVPARVIPGNGDGRVLGIHFNGFEYSP